MEPKQIVYLIEDLIYYIASGALLAYLLEGMLPKRVKDFGIRRAGVFMAFQFCMVRMAFAWSPFMKRLMYGQDLVVSNSKQSIIPLAASLVVTLAAGLAFFGGSRIKLFSLAAAFYAQSELVRFFLYPAAVWSMNFVAGRYTTCFLEDSELKIAAFEQCMARFEMAWNTVINAGNAAILGFCVWQYKKELVKNEDGFAPWEAALLSVPGLMGLLFAVMLRCILFYYKDGMFSIIKSYPELNVMIPGMSFLCLMSVQMSARMQARVSAEHEKRRQAEVYRSQVEELTAHVQDMESVYIQIRGMKHDMKNYIADVKGLLAQVAAGDAQADSEVRRYVDSMQESLAGLEMQCATANPVTDVVIGRYMRMAKQKQVTFLSRFVYPKHLGIDVFDLSIILNNSLENALEASELEETPVISLDAVQKGNMFLITVENTFGGVLNWAGGLPVSGKPGGSHGFGLKNICRCAEKYYGRVDVKTREGRFCLTVMLQGRMCNPDSGSPKWK